MTNVYLMERADGLIKIGRSRTPRSRRIAVQYEVKQKVELLKIFPVGKLHPHAVERKAHDLLVEKRIIGEWFETSFDEASLAIKEAIGFVKENGTTFKTRVFHGVITPKEFSYISIPLPESLYNSYKQLSADYRRTVSNQILVALEFAIENPEYLS